MSPDAPVSRDSISNILRVSILLCLVCAVGVSLAAVGLKERQEVNKRLDLQRNVLAASGAYELESLTDEKVAAEFKQNVDVRYVDLETGKEVPVSSLPDGEAYDPRASVSDASLRVAIPPEWTSRMGLRFRAPYYPVYFINREGSLDTVILPIVGNGLWSTMYGFLALEPDLKTVRGINYYEHGETPGLGGEVDNPMWKGQWKGKVVYAEGEPAIDVIKGSVNDADPNAEHKIDGLAGATITANGVEGMINYWLSDEGFGKYLKARQQAETASARSRVWREASRRSPGLASRL